MFVLVFFAVIIIDKVRSTNTYMVIDYEEEIRLSEKVIRQRNFPLCLERKSNDAKKQYINRNKLKLDTLLQNDNEIDTVNSRCLNKKICLKETSSNNFDFNYNGNHFLKDKNENLNVSYDQKLRKINNNISSVDSVYSSNKSVFFRDKQFDQIGYNIFLERKTTSSDINLNRDQHEFINCNNDIIKEIQEEICSHKLNKSLNLNEENNSNFCENSIEIDCKRAFVDENKYSLNKLEMHNPDENKYNRSFLSELKFYDLENSCSYKNSLGSILCNSCKYSTDENEFFYTCANKRFKKDIYISENSPNVYMGLSIEDEHVESIKLHAKNDINNIKKQKSEVYTGIHDTNIDKVIIPKLVEKTIKINKEISDQMKRLTPSKIDICKIEYNELYDYLFWLPIKIKREISENFPVGNAISMISVINYIKNIFKRCENIEPCDQVLYFDKEININTYKVSFREKYEDWAINMMNLIKKSKILRLLLTEISISKPSNFKKFWIKKNSYYKKPALIELILLIFWVEIIKNFENRNFKISTDLEEGFKQFNELQYQLRKLFVASNKNLWKTEFFKKYITCFEKCKIAKIYISYQDYFSKPINITNLNEILHFKSIRFIFLLNSPEQSKFVKNERLNSLLKIQKNPKNNDIEKSLHKIKLDKNDFIRLVKQNHSIFFLNKIMAKKNVFYTTPRTKTYVINFYVNILIFFNEYSKISKKPKKEIEDAKSAIIVILNEFKDLDEKQQHIIPNKNFYETLNEKKCNDNTDKNLGILDGMVEAIKLVQFISNNEFIEFYKINYEKNSLSN